MDAYRKRRVCGVIFAVGLVCAAMTGVASADTVLGDMNINGFVDFDDIGPFVLALRSPVGYEDQYGMSPVVRGDTDSNGIFDFDDIPGFVRILGGQDPNPAVTSAPLPPSVLSGLAMLGLLGAYRVRRLWP